MVSSHSSRSGAIGFFDTVIGFGYSKVFGACAPPDSKSRTKRRVRIQCVREALNKFLNRRHASESWHPENSLKLLDSGFRRNDDKEKSLLIQRLLRLLTYARLHTSQ